MRVAYLDRCLLAIESYYNDNPNEYLPIEEVLQIIRTQADENNEVLGSRARTSIVASLSKLRVAKYIKYKDDFRAEGTDQNTYIKLLPAGENLLKDVRREKRLCYRSQQRQRRQPSPLEQYHILVQIFRRNLKGKLKAFAPREKIDRDNRYLEYENGKLRKKNRRYRRRLRDLKVRNPTPHPYQQPEDAGHENITDEMPFDSPPQPEPAEQEDIAMAESEPSTAPGTPQMSSFGSFYTVGGLPSPAPFPNDMEIDFGEDIALPNPTNVGGNVPETPLLHRSGSLNNPLAYPSPVSLERQVAPGHSSGSLNEQTPSRPGPEWNNCNDGQGRAVSFQYPLLVSGMKIGVSVLKKIATAVGIASSIDVSGDDITIDEAADLLNREAMRKDKKTEEIIKGKDDTIQEKELEIQRLTKELEAERKAAAESKDNALKVKELEAERDKVVQELAVIKNFQRMQNAVMGL